MPQAIQPELFIDGPYSTPLGQYTKFNLAILISNGSGLSPFLSILRSHMGASRSATEPSSQAPPNLQRQLSRTRSAARGSMKVRLPTKLVFVWVVRYWQWLSWIQDDLEELLHLAAKPSSNVQLVVFITSSDAPADITGGANVMLRHRHVQRLPRAAQLCVDVFHKEYT